MVTFEPVNYKRYVLFFIIFYFNFAHVEDE